MFRRANQGLGVRAGLPKIRGRQWNQQKLVDCGGCGIGTAPMIDLFRVNPFSPPGSPGRVCENSEVSSLTGGPITYIYIVN